MSTAPGTEGFSAVILAGGRGTRLAGVIGDIPKPMAPVAGRPFLEHLLERLSRHGFTRAVLSVGYLHQKIQDHFGDRFRGIALDYALETEPLGTGGGLRLAMEKIPTGPVFAFNGDTMTDIDIAAFYGRHVAAKADLTIAVVEVPDTARYGACTIVDGHVAAMAEKGRTGPGYINAGIYLMDARLLERAALPHAFSFETDFLEARLAALRPAAYPFAGRFIDIGVPSDYAMSQTFLAAPLP